MGGLYQKRDPEVVYEDMAHIRRKAIVVPDASFGLDKKHLLGVMEAIAPLGKNLYIETTLARLRDREVIKSMADGGVKGIAMGIETLSDKMNKHGSGFSLAELKRVVRECHEHGILVQGNFILGLDSDGTEIFEEAYRFCKESELDHTAADVLVPYPHTSVFDTMLEKGRIIERDWSCYDYRHIVYQPLNMSVEELRNGLVDFCKRVSKTGFFLEKLRQLHSRAGLSSDSAMVAIYNLSRHLDIREKSRKFSRMLPSSEPILFDAVLDPISEPSPE